MTEGGTIVQGVPGIGDRAPSFTLRKTFEEKMSLEDLLERGPLLLAFYVFDFGSV